MPKNKLRRAERALDLEAVRVFLQSAYVGRLASIGPDGPYITPLCFVFAAPNTIYFHSAHTGHKLNNIHSDPRVCFEVDEALEVIKAKKACNYSLKYISVVAFGTAHRVTDSSEKAKAFAMLMEKYGGDNHPLVPEAGIGDTTIIGFNIGHMTGKTSFSEDELRRRLQEPPTA